MTKIALIPIDNRPICYDLIKNILAVDSSCELFMPDIGLLGGLTTKSDIEGIFDFINNLDYVDYIIVSLDTVAYGGLVASRRCCDTYEEIKSRIYKLKSLLENKAKHILAFSSVMRISNNNINEEEKEYWNQWGKRIFEWSYHLHKSEKNCSCNCVINKVPSNILADYLETRKRNFEINKIYLNWAERGFFDTLIFSKDDCAQYGLNVKEADELSKIIKEKNIKTAFIKTGADEIPLSLISRAILKNEKVKIKPEFLEKNSIELISKYEDIPISECVKAQLTLANCDIVQKDADITLLVNNFSQQQGDLVLGDIINSTDKEIIFPDTPFFVADVNNANGADSGFVEQLFKTDVFNFFGYCGYNTSANTIGCAILSAVVKFLAIKNGTYSDLAFKKLEFIRFTDDWAYQAISRKYVRESAPQFDKALKEKEEELNNNSKKVSEFLGYYPEKITYSLPWNRSFEVRINI